MHIVSRFANNIARLFADESTEYPEVPMFILIVVVALVVALFAATGGIPWLVEVINMSGE